MRLHSLGHDVFASCPYWSVIPCGLGKLLDLGIPVWRRKPAIAPFWIRLLRKAGFMRQMNWEKKVAANWLQDLGPDLVCLSDGGILTGVQWAEWCLELGIPYVVLGQANAVHWWPTDWEGRRRRNAVMEARSCYFVSRGNLELFEDQLGIAIPHAAVVRNPYQVDRTAPIDLINPAPDSGPWKLAIVGRLEPEAKGQDIVFHILSMPNWRCRNVHVSLFGSGPNKDNFELLAEKLDIQKQISFQGQIADVQEIWKTHHALVLPSRYEGLPLVVVEAMMCGRIGIVTDVAGNSEVIEDGVTGFVAEAATVRHFAAAMERAWDRRSDWGMMGLLAAQRIRELVPEDPAAVFAAKLVEIAEASPCNKPDLRV